MNIKRFLATGLAALSLSLAPAAGLAQKSKMVQIKGSDTMVNLVQILAEEFMAKNPGTALAVMGGGSGTGITAIINQTCDLANSSRDWRQKEIDQAWEKGIQPKFFAIAVDGLSVIVNASNPIERLTMAEVGSLYRGEIKNWKAVGGPDTAVSLYGRQSNSGTYVFFQEHVLGNKPFSTDVKEMNGNAQIIEGVIQDEGGVGYVGVGYLFERDGKLRAGLKVINISKTKDSPAFAPTDKKAVDSGDYPIARALFQATPGKPKGVVADFIRFEIGPEGQKIAEREGFYAVGGPLQEKNQKNLN